MPYKDKQKSLQNRRDYRKAHMVEAAAYQAKYYLDNPERYLLLFARTRAKQAGLPFSIDISDVIIPPTCPALGIPLVKGTREDSDASPSLDRVRDELGYVKGNVAVISKRANRIKNNSTADELDLLAAYFRKVENEGPVKPTERMHYPRLATKLLHSAKKRAEANGLEFKIVRGDLYIPITCPILGIALEKGNGKIHDASPSLDRINGLLGYIPENIHVISYKANRSKKRRFNSRD